MPTFKRCDKSVDRMAAELLKTYETHESLVNAEVKIDFVFAFCDRDNSGNPKNDALTLHGVKALGIAKKLSLKDRAKGMGDAEISLDGDWWHEANDDERKALLDHELHHLVFTSKRDDLGRPMIGIRPHDYQFGWFKIIAERHGDASLERKQSAMMMDVSGQYFWPGIRNAVSTGGRGTKLELTHK